MADVATTGAEGASSTAGSAAAGKVYTEAEVDELVSGLKRKNQELLGEKKQLAERTKAIPDGFDPAEFEALRKDKADRERQQAEAKGEWDKLRQSQAAEFEANLKKERDARAQLERELEAELIEGGASRILAGLNPVDKSLPMLLRYVRDNASVVVEDGKRSVRIKDGDGFAAKGGEYVGLETFVKGLPETFPNLFVGRNTNGSGAVASAGSSGKKTMPRAAFDALNAQQRFAHIDAGGEVTD